MTKVTIEAVGEPKTIQGQKGPFQVFGIKVNGAWMNGYYNQVTKNWKTGDEVEVLITEKEKDGKVYKNFSLPKKEDVMSDELKSVMSRLTKLELSIERQVDERFEQLKKDLVYEKVGVVNLKADLERSDKRMKPVFDELGISEDIPF